MIGTLKGNRGVTRVSNLEPMQIKVPNVRPPTVALVGSAKKWVTPPLPNSRCRMIPPVGAHRQCGVF